MACEVHAVENGECLKQHRTLAPRAASPDLDGAERGGDRRLDFHPEAGDVAGRQQAAVFPLVVRDSRGDVSLVEGATRRFEARSPPAPGVRGLLVHEKLKRSGEVFVP